MQIDAFAGPLTKEADMGLIAEESLIAQRLGKLGRKKTAA
jgi:hypothetical protein